MRAHPTRSLPLLWLSFWLAVGCGLGVENPSPGGDTHPDAGPDAGSSPDAGPGMDAGTRPDAGPVDAGADAGLASPPEPGPDAGTPPDSGTVTDAGTPVADAGSSIPDAGTPVADAGTPDAGPVGSCGLPYLGDPSAPLTFSPTAVGPTYSVDSSYYPSTPVGSGSIVSVVEPFQGGRVSFFGVRNVTNLDPCGVTLIGAIRDPITNNLQRDSRPFNLLRNSDGTGSSDEASADTFSNLTLCPNNWSANDLYGDYNYEITLILKDKNGKALQQVFTVKLACNVPGQESVCKCICKQGYKLGQPCP
jgi:hypothetical protein